MQVFKTGRIGGALAMLLCLAACVLPASAMAQDHAQHGHMSAGRKAELGTSAAVDMQGHIWIASKESAGSSQYVVLQKSTDGGKSWSASRRIQNEPEAISAEGENRPKLAFGNKGEIYVTYTKPLAKPYTGEIRFIRSLDGGQTFSPPITVHANRDLITHRFDSMIVDKSGRIYVAWIDKRDVEAAAARKKKYVGAALYYAVSDNSGASFKGDYKIADHSCECCRIALALNPAGKPVALWRHIFEPNARDHAMVELAADGKTTPPSRATFDDWRIDACPHHGPALAYGTDGTRHQAWFNVKDGEGGVFYASAAAGEKLHTPIKLGSAQAAHAEVAVAGKNIALAWKQFDGKATAILARISNDNGLNWHDAELAHTSADSDQPRLLNTPSGILLVWRTQTEGMRIIPVVTEK